MVLEPGFIKVIVHKEKSLCYFLLLLLHTNQMATVQSSLSDDNYKICPTLTLLLLAVSEDQRLETQIELRLTTPRTP